MLWAFLAGYVLGGLPTVYWFGALRGRAFRSLDAYGTLGSVPGLMALFLDLFKGALAVALGEAIAGSPLGGLWGGVGAVWGHAFSPWLFLRGGKALAPGLGVLFAVDPRLLLGAFFLFALLTFLSRKPRPALLATALAVPLLAAWLGKTPEHLLFGVGVSLPVVLRHLGDEAYSEPKV
ncbi:hypothetical protein TJA_05160 [Thermus sp. LT1-2-5]|uniref:glycerol-3-phosphate acyltransferase n=1 Tax=Thermus sp. LT1-2-5 TaxID=3026935 RepID=UPI0030E85C48